MRIGGGTVSAPSPRRRKVTVPQTGKAVKASILVGVELHARWAAAAALRGMDRSAFAVEAIEAACKGIHIIDRRKTAGRVDSSDRQGPALGISSDDQDAA
jgi:hypothetical protein